MNVANMEIADRAIAICRSIVRKEISGSEAVYFQIVDDENVKQEIQVWSPFKHDDLSEDLLDAVDVRLFVSYPRIEKTLQAAHTRLGISRPIPPFIVCLSQLAPSHEVFGGNAFPIFENQSIELQLATLRKRVVETLLPIVAKSKTENIFDDDSVLALTQQPARLWLFRAAKSVAYDELPLAESTVKKALNALSETEKNEKKISLDEKLNAIALKGEDRALQYALAVLGGLLPRPSVR
jgi:hypothetical protein